MNDDLEFEEVDESPPPPPRRRDRKADAATPRHRQPPHSIEAEEYLLSCCLLDGGDALANAIDAGIETRSFFIPENGFIWAELTAMFTEGAGNAIEVLAERLKDTGKLDRCGGYPGLMRISGLIPTTAQTDVFIDRVRELHRRREVIRIGTAAVEQAFECTDAAESLFAGMRSQIDQALRNGPESVGPKSLDQFSVPPINDPAVLLGHRFLERGHGAVIAASSGVGKSSLTLQAAASWAAGRDFFGIKCNGPLRSLIVQAEDSDADIGEVWAGVRHGLNLTDVEEPTVARNIVIVTERVRRGSAFAAKLRRWVDEFKPDLVWINPLLAYIDGSITEGRDVGAFLRGELNALNEPPRFAYVLVHHTNKPPTGKDAKASKNWSDWMYHMTGSADITNWARAVLCLEALPTEGEFNLHLAKRGRRAGVTRTLKADPDQGRGVDRVEPTTTITLRHATGTFTDPATGNRIPLIFWEPRPHDLPDNSDEARSKGGRRRKYEWSDLLPALRGACSGAANVKGLAVLHRAAVQLVDIPKGTLADYLTEAAERGDIVRTAGGYYFPTPDPIV